MIIPINRFLSDKFLMLRTRETKYFVWNEKKRRIQVQAHTQNEWLIWKGYYILLKIKRMLPVDERNDAAFFSPHRSLLQTEEKKRIDWIDQCRHIRHFYTNKIINIYWNDVCVGQHNVIFIHCIYYKPTTINCIDFVIFFPHFR